jgi:rRNA maturation endonuclease Nob1
MIYMAIFDDVVVNAKSAAAVVSKKAGTIIDLSKLRISLASLRSELNKQYVALGEAVYNNEPIDEIDAIKAAIDEVKQNIDDVEKILDASRNTITCPACGQKLPKSAQFCSTCGTQIPKKVAVCKSCGAELQPETKFCAMCGTSIGEADDTSEE